MRTDRKTQGSDPAEGSPSEQSGAKPKAAKPARLTQRQRVKLAQQTRDEVYRKASDMITKMITEVTKKGNHTTAKFLFDFAGIDQIPLNEKERKHAEDSLAALLLRELRAAPSEADPGEGGRNNVHLTQ